MSQKCGKGKSEQIIKNASDYRVDVPGVSEKESGQARIMCPRDAGVLEVLALRLALARAHVGCLVPSGISDKNK